MIANKRIKTYLGTYFEGFLNSYAQIFFSNNKLFALLLLLISFFDFGGGLSGAISILVAQLTASLFNLNTYYIKDGSYTYNPLMVGIALGMFYEFNLTLLGIIIVVSVLTLLLSVKYGTAMAAKGLPFLSIPFLLGIWVVILGIPNFSSLVLNQKQMLSLAQMAPGIFSAVTDTLAQLPFGNAMMLYFRSLGAIFFQYNDLAGLIIAIGLLYYSRIAFELSIFGFLIGYLFYTYFEGDFSQLIYSYIGFNFILTSIALGGFFVVPSRKSFLILLILIPIIAILISALHTLFSYVGLPLYSLPFNIVTLLFLAVMLQRSQASGIHLVTLQQFQPEKNHYKFLNSVKRFANSTYYHIALPVIGTWRISQGHAGKITHKNDWQYAWDFDIVDDNGNTYKMPGTDVTDYYCYNLPVTAPASGYVVLIENSVEDNKIGDVNLEENWGNTIIIKHGEGFYSKLSHLKKDSFKVKVNDFVQKGQIVAACGSSGRSPEPHLHFQLQATPYIGSKTLKYPVAHYISHHDNNTYRFHEFDIPKENDFVSNVQTTKILTEAFKFIPGQTLQLTYNQITYRWEVFVDAYNKSYIYCHTTKSTAYFVNNGTLFYFTDFYGKYGSLLHHFYYACQKVLLGYYPEITLQDELMIQGFFNPLLTAFHDFTAPFFHYLKVNYRFAFQSCDSEHQPTEITINTECQGSVFNKFVKQNQYSITVKEGKITSLTINNKEALCRIE